jgi:hypothetical protein
VTSSTRRRELLVSVLVGKATIGGLILLIIPGIYIGVRLAVSIERWWWRGGGGPGRWGAPGSWSAASTSWFVQAVVAAVATVVTLAYGVLLGVLLSLDLRARKEGLTLETLRTNLQTSAA